MSPHREKPCPYVQKAKISDQSVQLGSLIRPIADWMRLLGEKKMSTPFEHSLKNNEEVNTIKGIFERGDSYAKQSCVLD